MVYQCIKYLQYILYPPTCLLCTAPADTPWDICSACRSDLPVNNRPCSRCALPLGYTPGGRNTCGKCLRKEPAFDHCFSPFIYRPPISHMIGRLKFHNGLVHGRLLSMLLAEQIVSSGTVLPELLLPVPLHPHRLRERGFNQASVIAQGLSGRLGIPVDYRICRRVTATRAQSTLDQGARLRNMRGAFLITGRLRVKHVAVIDDVVTTGATTNELAGVLKRSGVERVDVWSCARTA